MRQDRLLEFVAPGIQRHDVQEQWTRIEQRLRELGCFEDMKVRSGASTEKVTQLERHLGRALPAPVREFWNLHDGQDGFGLIFGAELLSVQAISDCWDGWRSLDEAAMNQDCAEFMRSEPEGAAKALYCNPAWIPLTHDAGGNHIGLDFDPGPTGDVGQLITFGADEDTKRLLAPSFEAFIEKYLRWLDHASWDGAHLKAVDDL